MKILAIDTVGYGASVAITENNRVLFSKTASFPVSFPLSGGLDDVLNDLPQLHQKSILNLVEDSFKKTKLDWEDIGAVAASAYSGIYHCVLAGLATASALSHFHRKSFLIADHLLAHAYSCWIERNSQEFRFPILVFSASGSHSGFYLITGLDECKVIYDRVPKETVGNTETFIGIGKLFDKIGRRLNITSSESDIKKVLVIMSKGNSHKYDFVSGYSGGLFDFDFSELMLMVDKLIWRQERESKINPRFIGDIAASFQESLCEILSRKIIEIAGIIRVREVHICGGISNNDYLRKKLKRKIAKEKLSFNLCYPLKKEYGLDNAAMIGALAHYQQKYKIKFVNFKPQITR
jgi:N6-L-threonylcarbamoyladenine synthase